MNTELTDEQFSLIEDLYEFLCGPEACDFRENEEGKTIWTCYHDLRFTNKWLQDHHTNWDTLTNAGWQTDIHWHACCDCEVIFNCPIEFEEEEEDD